MSVDGAFAVDPVEAFEESGALLDGVAVEHAVGDGDVGYAIFSCCASCRESGELPCAVEVEDVEVFDMSGKPLVEWTRCGVAG